MILEDGFFGSDELFFSRTDQLGKIISGNNIFQRVSGFDWEEMLGRPHNIVRHDDMPRAVFFVIWSLLKKKMPVGGYVKNKTKNGKFYWVFSLILPFNDEFVSIRFKPSTKILEVTEKLYGEIRLDEKEVKRLPNDSAEKLLIKLKSLGFESYEDFMWHAFMMEMNSWTGIKKDELTNQSNQMLAELLEQGKGIGKVSDSIIQECSKNIYLSLNLNIEALKLGTTGASLGRVSEQFQKMISEIQSEIKIFSEIAIKINKTMKDNQFLVYSSNLIDQMVYFFDTSEKGSEHINTSKESVILNDLSNGYNESVKESFQTLITIINQLCKSTENLLTIINGLEVVRITGKIEMARIDDSQKIFTTLNNDLKVFVDVLKNGLKEIQISSQQMGSISHELLNNYH